MDSRALMIRVSETWKPCTKVFYEDIQCASGSRVLKIELDCSQEGPGTSLSHPAELKSSSISQR